MKILSFAYHDKARKWRLEPTTFGQLTLLVGASGVGKTQILRAICKMAEIANGHSFKGIEWRFEFQTSTGDHYLWQGEFENQDNPELLESETYRLKRGFSKLLSESLYHNEQEILRRDENDIYLNGEKTVKLSQDMSATYLLRAEPQLIDVTQELRRSIVMSRYANREQEYSFRRTESRFKSIESLRNSVEGIKTKLYLCSIVAPTVFDEIKERFIDVFPFVEDMRIEFVRASEVIETTMVSPLIHIRERGVDDWIQDDQLSSGMYRTLYQLSELYLCPDGTVHLIDEFENSLGVNCIDDLTSVILSYQRELQFILTSHHPYIINNINYKHWKIITRQGGVVTAHDATDFNLGKSKHQAFTQLINLDAYNEGVDGGSEG